MGILGFMTALYPWTVGPVGILLVLSRAPKWAEDFFRVFYGPLGYACASWPRLGYFIGWYY